MLQIKLTFMTYFTWKWVCRNTIIGDAGHEQKECDSFGVLVNIHVVQWISIANENSKTVIISMRHFYLPFLSKFRWKQGFLRLVRISTQLSCTVVSNDRCVNGIEHLSVYLFIYWSSGVTKEDVCSAEEWYWQCFPVVLTCSKQRTGGQGIWIESHRRLEQLL